MKVKIMGKLCAFPKVFFVLLVVGAYLNLGNCSEIIGLLPDENVLTRNRDNDYWKEIKFHKSSAKNASAELNKNNSNTFVAVSIKFENCTYGSSAEVLINGEPYPCHTTETEIMKKSPSFNFTRSGEWENEVATIVASVFIERDKCPLKTVSCNDVCKNKINPKRCIPEALICDYDRLYFKPACTIKCELNSSVTNVCYNFWIPYAIAMFLGTVFFIMVPTTLVFLLFYRRRFIAIRREEQERQRQYLHSIAIIAYPRNDHPPSYAEVHDIKDSPPCFCAAVSQPGNDSPGMVNEGFVCTCQSNTTMEVKSANNNASL